MDIANMITSFLAQICHIDQESPERITLRASELILCLFSTNYLFTGAASVFTGRVGAGEFLLCITAMVGAITSATIDISLIRMFIEGPEVSLNGSPTVSPVTDALCGSDFL